MLYVPQRSQFLFCRTSKVAASVDNSTSEVDNYEDSPIHNGFVARTLDATCEVDLRI